MSSAFIPKEKLSAYQRWELSNFDAQSQERVHEGKDQLEKNDELLRVAREQAQREGFDAGYQSGAAEAAAQTALFARLAEECRAFARAQDEALAQELLSLACAIARRMLGETLACDAGAVLPVIKEALARVAHARSAGQVAIHPKDAPLVRARLGDALTQSGWQIVEDVTLSRGGCRLECQSGDIDASVEHRWQRLMETLGQTGTWIKSIPE